MTSYKALSVTLKKIAAKAPPSKISFFKTGKGDYAEKDKFLGVNMPTLRKLAKEHRSLPIVEIQCLIQSAFNEERMLALFILQLQYQKAEASQKEKLYKFYLKNLAYVNNWNLVDASAHLIIGAHLLHVAENKDKQMLLKLAKSKSLWERRIAIVATWYFIRNNEHVWTYKIAKILLKDEQDLIHKAVGWMLRESGQKNSELLLAFLKQYAKQMPRTMLRYAIEKFPEKERRAYLLA